MFIVAKINLYMQQYRTKMRGKEEKKKEMERERERKEGRNWRWGGREWLKEGEWKEGKVNKNNSRKMR